MGQERRALHEKWGKRRHADIGHRVMAVLPTPLVRQTRTGRPQPRYEVLDRTHMALESDSPRPRHCPNAPRFNLSHPLNGSLLAKMRTAGVFLVSWTPLPKVCFLVYTSTAGIVEAQRSGS
jgi:hypothetical protein